MAYRSYATRLLALVERQDVPVGVLEPRDLAHALGHAVHRLDVRRVVLLELEAALPERRHLLGQVLHLEGGGRVVGLLLRRGLEEQEVGLLAGLVDEPALAGGPGRALEAEFLPVEPLGGREAPKRDGRRESRVREHVESSAA